jgi:hypothetical protein
MEKGTRASHCCRLELGIRKELGEGGGPGTKVRREGKGRFEARFSHASNSTSSMNSYPIVFVTVLFGRRRAEPPTRCDVLQSINAELLALGALPSLPACATLTRARVCLQPKNAVPDSSLAARSQPDPNGDHSAICQPPCRWALTLRRYIYTGSGRP